MICLGYNLRTGIACDNENFLPGERKVSQYYKELYLKVLTPVMICTHCGWFTVGADQIGELRKRTLKEFNDIQSKAKKSNGRTGLRRR